MIQVRIFACAGAGMTLAALGWFLTDTHGVLPDVVSANVLSRSAGLALLGVAMLAAGLAFRAAMVKPPVVEGPRPRDSEYRRGFADRKPRGAQAQPRRPTERGVVVSLRRAVAEQGNRAAKIPDATMLPPREIERLQDMLQIRAAQLCARNAEVAKRRFMRSGVDLHGLTPQEG